MSGASGVPATIGEPGQCGVTGGDATAFGLFISYSRTDMEMADRLVGALEAEGFRVTIDRRDLPYGQEWQGELAEFIRTADTVLWLVSPASIQSKWCNWELGEVQRLNKRLMPVVVAPVQPEDLPPALGRIHLLPVEGVFSLDEHLLPLVSALRMDAAWMKEHSRLADRAHQWMTGERRNDLLLRGAAVGDAEAWRDRQPDDAPAPSPGVLDLILASRRGQARRQQFAVGGSLLVAALAIGLSVFAFVQRNEAVQAQGRAEDALEKAAFSTNRIVFNLVRRFEATGMPTPVLIDILEQSQGLLDRVGLGSADNAELLWSRSATLNQIGSARLELGEPAAALVAFEESIRLARQILAQAPDDPDIVNDVSVNLSNMAHAYRQMGRIDDAQSTLEQVVSARRQLVAGYPDNLLYQRALSVALIRLSDMLGERDDHSGAKARLDEAFAIRRHLVASDPGNTAWRRDLGEALDRLGRLQRAQGAIDAAIDSYRESAGIGRGLLEIEPENVRWQVDLAGTLAGLAQAAGGSAGRAYFGEGYALLTRLSEQGRLPAAGADLLTWYERQRATFGLPAPQTGSGDGGVLEIPAWLDRLRSPRPNAEPAEADDQSIDPPQL